MAYHQLQPEPTAALRRWKLIRVLSLGCASLFGAAVLLEHLGCFGYRGDDWSRFDGQRATVVRITPQCTLIISRDGHETELRLLGLKPPDESSSPELRRELTARLNGKLILLKLEPIEPRDAGGHLLAYVYLESDCMNAVLLHDGLARADRGIKHSMLAPMEAAETDARKHARGLWAGK